MRKKNKGDVRWCLPNKKRLFVYSTRAESDEIVCLLETYGDLRVVLSVNLLLSPNERFIIQTLIDNGEYKPNLQK